MAKMTDLRSKMGTDNLNPPWVEFMLQRIAENDHAGDFALRPIFLTLVKPKVYEIGRWLEDSPRASNHGINPNVETRLGSLNWNAGPPAVDLVLANWKNLFLRGGISKTEREICDGAAMQRLRTCPDWVVPALAMWAEKEGAQDVLQGITANVCLTSDVLGSRERGFAMWIRRTWSVHGRTLSLDPWDPVQWILVKPRMQIIE